MGDFEKKLPASACRKKKIASSTNAIESLSEKKGKKYPAHHIARKKNSSIDDQKSTTPPPPPPPPPPILKKNDLQAPVGRKKLHLAQMQ